LVVLPEVWDFHWKSLFYYSRTAVYRSYLTFTNSCCILCACWCVV